jgi:hypothetical protein
MLSAFLVSLVIVIAASVSGGGPAALASVSEGGPVVAPPGLSGGPASTTNIPAADSVSGGGPA